MLLVVVSNFNTVQLQKTDFLQQVSSKMGEKRIKDMSLVGDMRSEFQTWANRCF